MYKKDFEIERLDRERMAGEIERARLLNPIQPEQHLFCHEERMKHKIVPMPEVCNAAVLKIKELLELTQTLQTKEETWKRSLEEARASSSRLNKEVERTRSHMEKQEQMYKRQIQQVLQTFG